MQRFALGIEYEGSNYFGWQRQRAHISIQEQLEKAITQVANHPVAIFCAGRTDAGVHAVGQVIHFDTTAVRNDIAWVRGVNTFLPADIRVCWSKKVSQEFDARKSALSRRYCYILVNRAVSPGVLSRQVGWISSFLDISVMQEAANYLIGTHDFSAFRAAYCQAKSPVRTIYHLHLHRQAEHIILDIKGNAFLHHMVRNIMGTLIAVGQAKYPPAWVKQVLETRDRRCAGFMAPAQGLYLFQVNYPSHFELPLSENFPWFLPNN